MTRRVRVVSLGALLAACVGCGQQGPLVLPDSARPIERVGPSPNEPQQTDDEQQDER
jgi:predicted small lipoprotein YifL